MTGEAEGTKTRGAAETSSEIAHVPDPLYLTVDGEAREPISPATAVTAIWGIKLRESMSTRPNLSATTGSSESMGTTTAEPQAVPEKKMRSADGVVLVANEAGSPTTVTAAKPRPSNWETLSPSQKRHWRKRYE